MPEYEDFMTLREASVISGRSPATLLAAIKRRLSGAPGLDAELVDTPRGPVWLVTRAEIERYRDAADAYLASRGRGRGQ